MIDIKLQFLEIGLALYLFSYIYYIKISHGLGNKATYLQMRRFIPCAILAVLPAALTNMNFTSPVFILPLVISLLWIITYPALYYIDNHRVSSDFEFHFETVFALYFLGWITALLGLSSIIPILSLPAAIIISLIEFIILYIPLAQIIYFLLYRSCINENAVQLILETNQNEIIEYFKSLPVSYNILALLFLLLAPTSFFAINYNFLQVPPAVGNINLFLLGGITVFLTVYLWKKNHGVFIRTAIVEFFLDVKHYLDANASYKKNTAERIKDLQVEPLGRPFAAPATNILIIGESASRDYMKAFNTDYKYETTPWLSSCKDTKNFILFPHAFSTCANTVAALSRALTEFNQYDGNEFFTSCSIVDIAKKLGYKVHWYSNQGHLGAPDTAVTIIANSSDTAKWTKQELNKVQYDESLLDYLDELEPPQNNFLVIHLKGSHFNFLNRYPPDFTKFGTPGKYQLEENYANSIAYTDQIIKKIFDYAKEKLNLQSMVYFSDHATIPDKRRSPNFEGLGLVRIPLFIYLSDEYIDKNPAIYKNLRHNQNRYWTNDLAYELICSIFNIRSNKFKEENSLASEKFKFNKEDLRTNLGKVKL